MPSSFSIVEDCLILTKPNPCVIILILCADEKIPKILSNTSEENIVITCPKCQKQLENGSKFCDECGSAIPATVFCANCGTPVLTGSAFCQNCGLAVGAVPVRPKQETTSVPPTSSLKNKLRSSSKTFKFGIAGVALLLVAALVLSLILCGGSDVNFALYLKEGQLQFANLDDALLFQVTDRLDEGGNSSYDELAEWADSLGLFTTLSPDGDTLFYVDRITSDGLPTLYYRSISKPEMEPVKIDTNIAAYLVSDDGKLITYLKGEDYALYQHNLVEKEKIASEVTRFKVSSDGKTILYATPDNSIYRKKAGQDREEIDVNVDSILYVSKDLGTLIYYIEEEGIYKNIIGSEKTSLVSHVDSVLQVYDSGEFYFTTANTTEYTLSDFVYDDMEHEDAALSEPIYPDYPSYFDYQTNEEYQAAVDRFSIAVNEYNLAMDVYSAKQERDYLRQRLAEQNISLTSHSLFFFDGEKAVNLTNDLVESEYTVSQNSPIIFYSVYERTEFSKTSLSEISDFYELQERVEEHLKSYRPYYAIKANLNEFDYTAPSRFVFSEDGKTVYFISEINEETNHGMLYKATVENERFSDIDTFATGVYKYSLALISDTLIFMTDVNDGKGDLYINGNPIDFDVSTGRFAYLEDGNTIVYYTDWNSDKLYGTLKIYSSEKSQKIADDVSNCYLNENGTVLYMYDYSRNNYKGELYFYEDGKSTKIADEVIGIVPTYSFEKRNELLQSYIW